MYFAKYSIILIISYTPLRSVQMYQDHQENPLILQAYA